MSLVRILFVSDTHLGFDEPQRPRIERRRRGPDFFSNYERALEPAKRGEVDLVVHGGDVFYRSKVPGSLVERAFRPLKAVADSGIPVYVVPGNHERSRIPFPLLATHESVFSFDRPRTFVFERDGFRLALGGFPYLRDVRKCFAGAYRATGLEAVDADASLLLMHHAVEGARVGPGNFTFRTGSDVIRGADIPEGVRAVLSGHIHRAQALVSGLAAPVLYAGSVERTSFAEKDERKGYLTLGLASSGSRRGRLLGWKFHELPARPMIQMNLSADELGRRDAEKILRSRFASLPADAVVRLTLTGDVPEKRIPTAEALRSLAPATMNLSLTRRAVEPSRPTARDSASRSGRARAW